MAKYSEEFKLKLVEEYVEGTLGYKLLARKYELLIMKMVPVIRRHHEKSNYRQCEQRRHSSLRHNVTQPSRNKGDFLVRK